VIFVDTGFLFAFFSEDDVNHARVAEVFEEFKGRNLPEILVTTDHVVSETITLTRYRISHERAVFVGERLYSEKMARIRRASFEEQRAAFDYFKRHADKKYSTVDCLSFVVMESLGIRKPSRWTRTSPTASSLGRAPGRRGRHGRAGPGAPRGVSAERVPPRLG
jgi:predicted nucleic acid-binding protein